MAATLYTLHVPPIPWDTVGLDYLTHVSVSNGFDNVLIVVDHLTRMASISTVYIGTYRNNIGNCQSFFTWSLQIA
jgi:hypothetical protein